MINLDNVQEVLKQLNSIEMEFSKEYELDGRTIPRVTEVLSQMLHNDNLMSWSNSLGFKRIGYKHYMREAAEKGTYSHLAIEHFLKTKEIPSFVNTEIYPLRTQSAVYNTFHGFLKWWEDINKNHKVEIIFSEKRLLHPYFGGTCDCVLKIDGDYWLIDFKTSNHMKYNYTLQLAAYRYLLKELENIEISGCIVLLLNKTLCAYNEYLLNIKDNPDHAKYMDECLETFLLLVSAYKMRIYTESQYDNIFKDKE